MFSRRSQEGYLLIENRHAPALSEVDIARTGREIVQAPSGGVIEAPTITCSHCQAIVFINPNRTREREWCWNCDHYICDPCGALKKHGAPCMPLKRVIEETRNQAVLDLGKR